MDDIIQKYLDEAIRLNKDRYDITSPDGESLHTDYIKKLTNKRTGREYYSKMYDPEFSGGGMFGRRSQNPLKDVFDKGITEYVGYKIYKAFSRKTSTIKVGKALIPSLEENEDGKGHVLMMTSRADFGSAGMPFEDFLVPGARKYSGDTYDERTEKFLEREEMIMNNFNFINIPFLAYTGNVDLHSRNIIKKSKGVSFYIIDFEAAIGPSVFDVFNMYGKNIKNKKTVSLKMFIKNVDVLYFLVKNNTIGMAIEGAENELVDLLMRERDKGFIDEDEYLEYVSYVHRKISEITNTLKTNFAQARDILDDLEDKATKILRKRES